MKFSISKKGLTFIDVLVGIALMLIIFLGVFGAFQLGLKIVEQSKNKITASAIASGEIEKIRNLPYESVGTVGGSPNGILEEIAETVFNGINFTIERKVVYIVDSADGIASPEDACPSDYKKAEIKVSWAARLTGEISISTDIAPKNLAQECAEPGGVLLISAFDAYGIMVSSPLIEIKDPATDEILTTATPADGKHYFFLSFFSSPATYKVVVSRAGYSTERTYGSGETYNGETIITPEKPHPIVLDGQLTEISFSIDKVSSFLVDTLSPWGEGIFSDSFIDETKILQSSNIIVLDGEVNLVQAEDQYQSPGDLISITISPLDLINWHELSFTDSEPPNTQILYQVLYFDGAEWVLIPDSDLAGNSLGFGVSSIDLSGLDIIIYPKLRIKGILSTSDPALSPTLFDWQVSWINSQTTLIPNASFNLKGTKVVGTDINDEPIYKYSQDHVSNSSGHKEITNLEWDSYTFSVDPDTGLDLIDINPSPQPINLSPDTAQAVELYLDAENSLLVTVQDNETLEPIFSSSARLYNTALGYDTTQYTDENGQTLFIPLEADSYTLEVQASGYEPGSAVVSIVGDNTKIIKLNRIE